MAESERNARSETRSRWRTNAFLCALMGILLCLPVVFPHIDLFLEKWELSLGDRLTRNRADMEPPAEMALIGVDARSLNVLDVLGDDGLAEAGSEHLEAMAFGWPFPRSTHAALAEKLIAAGARLVIFDMTFPLPGEGDDEFRRVLETYPDRLVIGADFAYANVAETSAAAGVEKLILPADTVFFSENSLDARLGIVNFYPDPDGVIRSTLGLFRSHGNSDAPVYHSLALAALKQLGRESDFPNPEQPQHMRLASQIGAPDTSFNPIPYFTIFVPYDWEKSYGSGEFFRDKIVFVGATATGQFHDTVRLPQGQVQGVQLHMTVLAAALRGLFYAAPYGYGRIAMTLCMALLAFFVTFLFRRPLIGLGVLVAALALFLFAVVPLCYFHLDVLLPSVGPAMAFGFSGLFCFGSQYAAEVLEKARLRRTLERQVSRELAEHILSQPENYYRSLPGVRKPVTILFSDIRSFTTRSEQDDPVQLVSQLKEYLDAMGKVVFKHRGVVDKFIGDAVMAVWGNIRSDGVAQDARNAVAAAVEMMEVLVSLNADWEKRGWRPFAIGIGLNHGDAIFGMMGSEQKQEMTVIGDPVNQAARLEGLTKKFGEGIVIGPNVAAFLDGSFRLRSIGAIRTKGKDEAAKLFAVLGKDADAEWIASYECALTAFSVGRTREAKAAFEECLAAKPDDSLCRMYLDAIERGDGAGGVLTMTEK